MNVSFFYFQQDNHHIIEEKRKTENLVIHFLKKGRFWYKTLYEKMLPLTLLIGVSIWSGRIDAYRIGKFNQTAATRSGGFPKFSQSYSSSANKYSHEFYKFSNNNLERNRPLFNRNTCGMRSINYSPKRFSRIIGG